MSSAITLQEILAESLLRPVFQPIAALADGTVANHEVLIRGPVGTPLEFPDAMFGEASRAGLRVELELAALQCAILSVGAYPAGGRFFINISGQALIALVDERGPAFLPRWIDQSGVSGARLVLEITEHERVEDVDRLKEISDSLCARGVNFALDDFGDGHSSLRLWAELQPRYVKIDKFFTRDIESVDYKRQTFKALAHISEILGGSLIAEGIENAQQLNILRDLGVELGQGYFLGRPRPQAAPSLAPAALHFLRSNTLTPVPSNPTFAARGITAERLLISAPSVQATTSVDEVFLVFQEYPEQHALPVLAAERPVGLINRRDFIERYSRPFQRELLGKKRCDKLMNRQPRILERSASVDSMIGLLTSEDQRFLADGIIITDQGRYLGLGTGEQLVRTVTEQRLEAARHANPLTFLPGNIPITQHIEKLLNLGRVFETAYCDLNHFKPFNDQYGYWRGDEMIRLLSRILLDCVDNRLDFVGHVGGDDFIIVFQSHDWRRRCQDAIDSFNARAQALFGAEEIARGGIEAEDRSGNQAFFPLTTLSIGLAVIDPALFRSAEEVANTAALAKRYAKRNRLGLWVRETGLARPELVQA